MMGESWTHSQFFVEQLAANQAFVNFLKIVMTEKSLTEFMKREAKEK
jgi:DNA-binding FrmR family transcriptional regulator